MKLSVCIFTYNHVHYIAQAIEGALMQQTNFDFEIVIGEDCSTDGTREIVSDYQKRYPDKIRAILHPANLGMMGNNVYTINQCRGEYIALLDGDDYWVNDKKLQNQVDFLDTNPDYTFCCHDCRILVEPAHWEDYTCCGPHVKQTIAFADIICDVHIPTSSTLLRRKVLGDFPPRWFCSLNSTDRPLYLLLTSAGPAFYFNETWGVYRKHRDGQWTSQHYQSRWLTHLRIYRVVNRHFKHRYNTPFCRCESRMAYVLAIDLVKDRKAKRALCFFRKYIRNINGSMASVENYRKIMLFLFLYIKCKLGFISKTTPTN